MYDVIVVGGGPAGCQAAISAVTEGLDTALLEPGTIGGEIASSPHLENMAGYVYGVTGGAFGKSMEDQMYRLGVSIISEAAQGLHACPRGTYGVELENVSLLARSVVIATGQRFAHLDIEGTHADCVDYGPSKAFKYGPEAEGKTIAVVGGGNSAGQTIEYLGERADRLYVLAPELHTSAYLTAEIEALDNVEIHKGRLVEIEPTGTRCTVRSNGEEFPNVDRVFICAGVKPNTNWLQGTAGLSSTGHVKTSGDFQTKLPGVYAIGDCREGAVGRVPAALGEGAAVQPALWRYLHPVEEAA